MRKGHFSFHHHLNIFHHLHGVVQLLQLSIFTLSHQLQGADELCDGAAQVSEQVCYAALLVLLQLKLYCVQILFRGDGCNAGEGTRLTEQSVTLWLGHV